MFNFGRRTPLCGRGLHGPRENPNDLIRRLCLNGAAMTGQITCLETFFVKFEHEISTECDICCIQKYELDLF